MNLPNSSMLAEVPGHELTERLYQLRVKEREHLVEFLVYLGELDRRKLYLDLAFSSCFQFCVEQLGLSRSSTFRRVVAARGSTYLMELHHIVPFAVGGPAIASNLGLRCALHNRRHAEKELGEERVTRKIAHRRQAGHGGIEADSG
jgi:hypothetical protein